MSYSQSSRRLNRSVRTDRVCVGDGLPRYSLQLGVFGGWLLYGCVFMCCWRRDGVAAGLDDGLSWAEWPAVIWSAASVRAGERGGDSCLLSGCDCRNEASVWVAQKPWSLWSAIGSFGPGSCISCCSPEVNASFSWLHVPTKGVWFLFCEEMTLTVLVSLNCSGAGLVSSCLLGVILPLLSQCPAVLSVGDCAVVVWAGLWTLCGSAALLWVLPVSALCLHIEAIVFTHLCWRLCSAVSLTLGSGWSRDLTRLLASTHPQEKKEENKTCI